MNEIDPSASWIWSRNNVETEEVLMRKTVGDWGNCPRDCHGSPTCKNVAGITGVTEITIDGTSFDAYCDQDRDGGGWMLLLTLTSPVAQYGGSVSPFVTPLNVGAPSPEQPYSNNWNELLNANTRLGPTDASQIEDGRTEIRVCDEAADRCLYSTVR